MRAARPVTRQALRGGVIAVTLSALLSGVLDLPAWAQEVNLFPTPITDPDAPAFSAADQAAVDALAAQLAGATSRNAVVSILQSSTLPKAQVRAAVEAAMATRAANTSIEPAFGDAAVVATAVKATLDNLPQLKQQIQASGDRVMLKAFENGAKMIEGLVKQRKDTLARLEQARQANNSDEVAYLQGVLTHINTRLENELEAISVIMGADLQVEFSSRAVSPTADPVAETLKTVLGLIDASTGGSDTRLTFVDTQNNSTRNTSTAAITQPSVASTLAQNATVTIYVG